MHRKRFLSVSFFTCQSDFDAGPVPPSPRIRHHSGKNDHTNFPLECPKITVSPLNGKVSNFSLKSCGWFFISSRVKMYYFMAKSRTPSKPNNTGEHFRAGSTTYWRHVLNGYNVTCSSLGSVGVTQETRFFQWNSQAFCFTFILDTVSYITLRTEIPLILYAYSH